MKIVYAAADVNHVSFYRAAFFWVVFTRYPDRGLEALQTFDDVEV